MQPFTKLHEGFLNEKEDTTDDVSGYYSGFVTQLSKTQIYQAAEVTALLKAWELDRASMMGLTKKVLKKNGIEIEK